MRVELYLVDAMEVATFVPIWRALRSRGVDARIVAAPPDAHTGTSGWFDHATATRLLDEAGVPFVERADPASELAVTTQRPVILRPYRGLKARTMYAVGFYDMDGFQPDRLRGFDAVFAIGDHARRALSHHLDPTRVVVTGYPKYDDFFRAQPNRTALRTRLGLDATAPVIAYAPTWRDKSSIDGFADAVGRLAGTLLVRPHHCTARFEPARMAVLAGLPRAVVLPADGPLVDVVLAADLAIVDVQSGAFAEVLLVRPELPVVLLAPPNGARLDARLHDLAPIVERPEDLPGVVHDLLEHGPTPSHVAARHVATGELFSHRDGSAADRTAAAMIELVERTGGRS